MSRVKETRTLTKREVALALDYLSRIVPRGTSDQAELEALIVSLRRLA